MMQASAQNGLRVLRLVSAARVSPRRVDRQRCTSRHPFVNAVPVRSAAADQAYATDAASYRADNVPARRFQDWTVYRGKSALCVKVIKPQWEAAANGGLAMKRTGVILLEFAPANAGQGGQAGYGSRSYDWNNKQNLALSPTELGTILSANASSEVAIYHDPGKGTNAEGQTIKQLKIQPTPDGKGYMFNFNVKDGSLPGGQFYLNVPVSMPEMYVFRSIADFAIPRLLGVDAALEGMDVLY